MNKTKIVIATRESPLAKAQTEEIKQQLINHHPAIQVEILGITTQGDKRLDLALTEIGGKGLFVKELEHALLNGQADIAVHSVKDMPMHLPPGLILPVISKREDVRDVFVSNHYQSLLDLPAGAILGTASLRRQTQILAIRKDLDIRLLRGNINTRLERLDKGDYQAIILAAAGLNRLNLNSRIRSYLSVNESLPAAGQGALGIECREDDTAIKALIASLNDANTHACILAERALCRKLDGGCKLPLAAYAEIHNDMLSLRGLVANKDGTRILKAQAQGPIQDADNLGLQVALALLKQGAQTILEEFKI